MGDPATGSTSFRGPSAKPLHRLKGKNTAGRPNHHEGDYCSVGLLKVKNERRATERDRRMTSQDRPHQHTSRLLESLFILFAFFPIFRAYLLRTGTYFHFLRALQLFLTSYLLAATRGQFDGGPMPRFGHVPLLTRYDHQCGQITPDPLTSCPSLLLRRFSPRTTWPARRPFLPRSAVSYMS